MQLLQNFQKIIGIRQGEKIHEELISKSESENTYDINKYYVVLNQKEKLIKYYQKNLKQKKLKMVLVMIQKIMENF